MCRELILVHMAYCREFVGLLQAAAFTGALIMHKIADDMRKSAVLHVHHHMSVTQSPCHTNTLSGGWVRCYTGIVNSNEIECTT